MKDIYSHQVINHTIISLYLMWKLTDTMNSFSSGPHLNYLKSMSIFIEHHIYIYIFINYSSTWGTRLNLWSTIYIFYVKVLFWTCVARHWELYFLSCVLMNNDIVNNMSEIYDDIYVKLRNFKSSIISHISLYYKFRKFKLSDILSVQNNIIIWSPIIWK